MIGDMMNDYVACVTSVSVGLKSKERPRNWIIDVLPSREMW